jgi:hypothetical protein
MRSRDSMDKRAIAWIDNWAEWSAFSVMILGLIIALISDSAIISYTLIMLSGFMVGRAYYIRKSRMRFPFYLVTLFYLIGYTIGVAATKRGEPPVVVVCFLIGIYLGNQIYKRRLLR